MKQENTQKNTANSNSRTAIFRKLSQSLQRTNPKASLEQRRLAVTEHFLKPLDLPKGSAIGSDNSSMIERFTAAALNNGSTVSIANNKKEISDQLINACRGDNKPNHSIYAAHSEDKRLNEYLSGFEHYSQDVKDTKTNTITLVDKESSDPLTLICHADMGIAETGSAIFISTGEYSQYWNVLATNLVILINADDLVDSYEDTETHIRRISSNESKHWMISWIAGPSRTGDIEQTLIMGAHGAIKVHVILVK